MQRLSIRLIGLLALLAVAHTMPVQIPTLPTETTIYVFAYAGFIQNNRVDYAQKQHFLSLMKHAKRLTYSVSKYESVSRIAESDAPRVSAIDVSSPRPVHRYDIDPNFARGLRRCTNLKLLNLSGNKLHERQFESISSALRSVHSLEELNLNFVGIGMGLLDTFWTALVRLRRLEALSLSANALGNHLAALCDALPSLRRLRYIDLSLNGLHSDVRCLLEAFPALLRLEEVNIEHNALWDPMILSELRKLNALRSLRVVRIDAGNYYDEDELERLRKALPRVRVL